MGNSRFLESKFFGTLEYMNMIASALRCYLVVYVPYLPVPVF